MFEKVDKKLFGFSAFTAIAFNILMTRGCDTWRWSVIIIIGTFLFMCIPFLPEDWLKIMFENKEEQ